MEHDIAVESTFDNGIAGDTVCPDSLIRARLKEIQAFQIALENPVLLKQIEEDDAFQDVLQLAIDDYGVGQTELATILRTQVSTVGRWKSGHSFPNVYSRPGIIDAISSVLEKIIDLRK